ncbi:hypothetical protein J3E64_000620 [Sphingobium sp. OAS761]|uniref:PilZ domain-containing protein n=1 Tax=Sphingobium sp. OAS761 TaxID=2817901 RepID=UPI0020A186A7|nr:PilZ domain-containing protein [Sphingobium sp. OAS761]MCP1468949.1 hypothetical protein [Sphingobium sp. OAS761]
MQIMRKRERIVVDIPIVVTTVLDSLEGNIIDLSEGGAQVIGCALPAGTQCQIDLDGFTTFGTVRWSEEDRMGIRFPFELVEGPLYDRLTIARAARFSPATFQPRHAAATGGGGFGRRVG